MAKLVKSFKDAAKKSKKSAKLAGNVKMSKKGRIPLKDMDPKVKAQEIKELLGDLKDSSDAQEKKRIRRALRARGYYISKQEKSEE